MNNRAQGEKPVTKHGQDARINKDTTKTTIKTKRPTITKTRRN
jgi:hypothetical protein